MPARAVLPAGLTSRAVRRFQRISLYLVILASLSIAHPSSGETLRDLLFSYKVPERSFTARQLSASVQGTGKVAGGRAVIVYSELSRGASVGPLHAMDYDFARKVARTRILRFGQGDICMGSPEEVYLIDGYSLYSTHINPSAECLMLLDRRLAIRDQFYGFFPIQIAPGQIALIENMVHFAPVHAGRMEVIDLRTSAAVEIYPPANDPLRRQLSLAHQEKLPAPDICMRMNDPCKSDLFDEDIYPVSTDGRGRLAFVVAQSASHIFAENSEQQTVAEQSVFYSYAFERGSWHYCEEQFEAARVDALQSALGKSFAAEVSRHCKPDRAVTPDLSTATFNPFQSH